ncbi:MAG: excinuclease ABC subunit C [Calditrichaeota bacterium]|nr:excinuclease ABC subunit C [Calditrichota bacterium]MCB9366476.1 excinuclease ABC subunit C [Calditrichota bacterium]MCB9391266.1 excinuclease ABC subunit C [Calditrichota bacterium]
MSESLSEKLENLPKDPGVYLFRDARAKVIYVGKAKVLRNRVRQYFQKSSDGRAQFEILVSKIADLEVITTKTEYEAIILEGNLIRKFKPRYNVALKDDKSQPYLKIANEPFPRIFLTRNPQQDGSKLYGPYGDLRYLKGLLHVLRGMLKIRTCNLPLGEESIANGKFKSCLEFHLGRCNAPCVGHETLQEYDQRVRDFVLVLKGRGAEIIAQLRTEMEQASEELRFERAAQLRDWLSAMDSLTRRQTIISPEPVDRDIVGLGVQDEDGCLVVMQVRDGRLLGRVQYPLRIPKDTPLAEILMHALQHYYSQAVVPSELVLPYEPESLELLSEWLRQQADSKVVVRVPERGEKVRMVDLAQRNADLQLQEILRAAAKRERIPASLTELQTRLGLPGIPREIAAFDNSTLMGEHQVAGMVVYRMGKPARSEYRRFKIKTVTGQDDFASMKEVVTRRFSRLQREGQPMPDLILIDGGKGQLSAAVEALADLGLESLPIIGLAKKLEEIYRPGELEPHNLPKTSSALRLLQQVRDEVHRYAITYHRQVRQKEAMSSELQDIPGIGPARRKLLLTHFRSVQRLSLATRDELLEIQGISPALADKVLSFFQAKKAQ